MGSVNTPKFSLSQQLASTSSSQVNLASGGGASTGQVGTSDSKKSATAQSSAFKTPFNSDRVYAGLIQQNSTNVEWDNSNDIPRGLLREQTDIDTPNTQSREGNTTFLSSSTQPTIQQPIVYDHTSLLGNNSFTVIERCTEKILNKMWYSKRNTSGNIRLSLCDGRVISARQSRRRSMKS
jgi:hypothetical protein